VVVAQICAAVDVRCAMVPAEGRCSVISGGGSAARSTTPGATAEIPGAGAKVGSVRC
jgi:hypothetical protein